MASTYNRRINLYINGKQVNNDIKSVQSAMYKLRNEQKLMTIGSDEYVRHAQKIRQLKGILDKHNADLRKTQRGWISLKGTADKFNRYFGMITAGVASLTGLALGFRKASDEANKFEERLDNLSALTGLEGDQLEWLGKMAKQTSVEITESGIRIKQSAADILDAYTKMGSQRPELLKNKEALHEVTKNAIILSEAAKSELQPAVDGLAMAMNQHNIAGAESSRVINAMAAGSKEGAGDIPYLTKAIEKSGTTLSLMNVSLEENIGLIESVAPYYARAEMAGNSLDKVFLKLKAQQIGYVNGVFSVDAALDELQQRFANGETAAELFGVEHAKMAELLVQNRGEVERYTKAVTGTNVAIEQAVKNTNNNAAALAQARNKMNLVLIEFGEKLNPALLKSTNLVTYLIKALMKAPQWFKDNEILLLALAGAVAAYNAALFQQILLQGQSLAIKIKNFAIDKSLALASTVKVLYMRAELAMMQKRTAAQIAHAAALKQSIMYEKLFGKALLANPAGIIIAGIAALVLAIKAYDKYSKQAIELEKERKEAVENLTKANEGLKESYDSIQQNINELSKLSISEKQDLQDKIDKTIELAEAELALQEAKRLEVLEHNTRATLWQKTINLLLSANNGAVALGKNAYDAAINGAEASNTMSEGIDQLRERLAALKRQGLDVDEILNAESLGDAIGTETMIQLEEKLNKYNIALRNAAIGGEEYIRIQEKINKTQEALNAAQESQTSDDALAAFELAYKKQILYLKQSYADKENLEKEFQARMLANELAFLQAKLQLETDEGKRLDIQTQIVDKQLEYNKAIKEAAPEILKSASAVDEFNTRLLEEDKLLNLVESRSAKAASMLKKMTDQQMQQAETVQMIGNVVNDYVSGALNGTIDEYQTFGDTLILMSIDILRRMVPIWSAQILGYSLSSAESVLTWGAAGVAKWAALMTIMNGALSLVEGGVRKNIAKRRESDNNRTRAYAEGKYPDMEYAGTPKTGMYGNRPQLAVFNEVKGYPEMVIDGITTKRIQADFPGIMNAIYDIRDGRKPKMYAGGKYPDVSNSSPNLTQPYTPGGIDSETAQLLTNAIHEFMKWRPDIDLSEFKKRLDRIEDRNKQTKLN